MGAHNGNVVNNRGSGRSSRPGHDCALQNDGESCGTPWNAHQPRIFFCGCHRAAYRPARRLRVRHRTVHDDKLYAIKGSGLVVGIGEDFTCVSSDLLNLPLTRKVLRLNDSDVVC